MGKVSRILEALSYWGVLRTLFDTEYYLQRNPGVRETGMNPLLHYVLHGAAEGRKPHPLFDPAYYLSRSPEAGKNGKTPLAHFARSHGGTCANPHPLFDCESYSRENPDAAKVNPLAHYVLSERRRKRLARPGVEERGGKLFYFAALDVMDVKLTVVFMETPFDSKTNAEQQEVQRAFESRAARDGLAGTIVPIWKDRDGRTKFIAPPQQRPFFQIMKYDQLRAQANGTFACALQGA